MSNFIENAQWRYATKKYDSTKKVSNADLETLKKAVQLSASSFGLQPYKVIVVENPELREQLVEASWGQQQIKEASHLFVFANITDLDNTDLDAFFNNVQTTRGLKPEDVEGYKNFVAGFVNNLPTEIKNTWTSKQTYIALSNLLNAAAELKIDVTPMEGFEPQRYNEILGLDKLGLHASLVAPIGYRSEEDTTQHFAKVRKPLDELFITL